MSPGLIIFGVYSLFTLIVMIALEVKLDWTKDKELLLWYTETDAYTGTRERKFVKLFKLK
jgi:hypothetical protein